jgi:hypothetical protein
MEDRGIISVFHSAGKIEKVLKDNIKPELGETVRICDRRNSLTIGSILN